ncbi:(deoxy)nucleoside triphosphate pyrophosphohydrolase [Geobacter chapellei]|uniref:8-oxo-dGTP diphosphatase n=1 Tax=Pelotalea chapellei TaxID=44671 RepID=A0ABS5UCX1_9BACT|nr:(deoxy)nucleoside triphosphate pyrophosphohydrolase [Pelotalea chapellei]
MGPIQERKHVHVTCAIIEKDDLVLAAQRSASMSLPLKWEFPGGKIDPDESCEECLQREIMEELGITVTISSALPSHTHCYTSFTVTLYPFICTIDKGEIVLHEHAAITWLAPEKLCELDWAEADLPVIETYLKDFVNPLSSR